MKSNLRKMVAGLLLLSFLSGSALAQGRIATIDLRKVFDNYWKRKQADTAIKERAADMEKEHTSMVNDWKKSKDDYQTLLSGANDQVVSADERDKRKKAAEDKLKQLKETEDTILEYEKRAKTTLDEQLKRMRDNILGEIRTVINAKAQSAGYMLVIDTAAESSNFTPIVLYVNNKDSDLTDTVLGQLNAGAPPETTKAEEKPPEKKAEKKSGR